MYYRNMIFVRHMHLSCILIVSDKELLLIIRRYV
jgi:hypothetical protein